MASAISQIKNIFYISTISPERHYYSAVTNSKLPAPKSEVSLFLPAGARAGFLLDRPTIDFRLGPGLKVDERGFFALMWNVTTTYNREFQVTEFDHFLGLAVGALGPGLRSEIGFKISDGNALFSDCLLYTSPSPRDATLSRMPSSA